MTNASSTTETAREVRRPEPIPSIIRIPSWATGVVEVEGGVQWSREIKVETLPPSDVVGSEPDTITPFIIGGVRLAGNNEGYLDIELDPLDRVWLGDQRMTADQALKLAAALAELAKIVGGGR
jgi:hypothetical protein